MLETVKFEDAGLEQLAEMFRHCPDDPTFRAEYLKVSLLDYSLESLNTVEEYLESIRDLPASGNDRIKCIVRAGAYVGEVIRRELPNHDTHWIAYSEALKIDASFSQMGEQVGNYYSLYHGERSFCFPLAKVEKRIENGRENNVHSFAKVIIDLRKTQKL
jgi:hypothetical protein